MDSEKWEYQIVLIADVKTTAGTSAELNRLGKEGWEAVSISTGDGFGGYTGYTVLLKRKLG